MESSYISNDQTGVLLGNAKADEATEHDYFNQASAFSTSERQTDLCCCEYIDKDKQRSHILACCCNCAEFDLVFDRCIRCKRVEVHQRRGMLLTFQDRLRIPWRNGAKQVSMDTLGPVIAIPLIIAIAAINVYTACTMLLATVIFMGYTYYYIVKRRLTRSRFFLTWLVCSVANIIVLFELTAPLLELLLEEHLVLVIFVGISLYCALQAKRRAIRNHVLKSNVHEDELPDITEEEEAQQTTALLMEHDIGGSNGGADDTLTADNPSICQICRKYVQPRTAHCSLCQACIVRRDHHSYWLDCCIGAANHRYYFLALLFGEFGLLLGANLTLTAVCHPFRVMRLMSIVVMMPDDCSDVFDEYELGISFIIAIYALIIAVYICVILLKQCFLISKGITMSEYGNGQSGNRKTLWSNWKTFIF